MPTTEPLYLLGHTIVIHIRFVFVFGDSAVVGFLYVRGGYNFLLRSKD
jgi:hypothetical protein